MSFAKADTFTRDVCEPLVVFHLFCPSKSQLIMNPETSGIVIN
jgi:hypothetical protein